MKFHGTVEDYKEIRSPPSRRRGLKSIQKETARQKENVASLAEAWIEMDYPCTYQQNQIVASLAEAWIEIDRVLESEKKSLCRLPRGGVD